MYLCMYVHIQLHTYTNIYVLQLIAEDFQQLARSGPIPYDATPSQMKEALNELTNVKIVEVRRCDIFSYIYIYIYIYM